MSLVWEQQGPEGAENQFSNSSFSPDCRKLHQALLSHGSGSHCVELVCASFPLGTLRVHV